jgi:predicted CXXCH cytochrome family protein
LVGNDNAANSGLPYGDLADIQCSSCHNPHEDVVRPFMRVPAGSTVQTLCALCHDSRNNTSGSGTGNGTAGNNDSMHPNNIAYPAPSSTQYDPGLIASSDANWVELFSANGRGTASQGEVSLDNVLGGKLLGADGTSGDFGCPTCHAVHGSNVGATTGQFDHLLSANNNVSGQNGATLCEACHTGGFQSGGTVLVLGGNDHPVDNILSGRAAATYDFTPWGSTVAYESTYITWPKNNRNDGAACTSCHSAHYGVGESPMQRSGGDATEWCNSCHTGASKAPPAHHSNRDIWANSLIGCEDCHRTSAPNSNLTTTSAHRDFAALENVAAAPVNSERASFCLKCHAGTAFTPVGGSSTTIGSTTTQPGVYNPTTDTGSVADFPATHGVLRTVSGDASSHYLGASATFSATDNITMPREVSWGTYGGSPVYSAYGTSAGALTNNHTTAVPGSLPGTTEMICESCHSVRWNAFIDNSANYDTAGMYGNLLLYAFEDDGEGTKTGTGSAAIGSVLCVGCHYGGDTAIGTLEGATGLDTYKPDGTHPVTGSTVTEASDVGRDPVTLITGSGTYADCNTIVPMSYPNTDEMDCDSCHRAHDGDPDSDSTTTSYILEEAASTTNVQSMCVYCHDR